MTGKHFPSGDPTADRRASFAETMAHLGDLPTAIETMRAALDLAPGWAAGWFRMGEWHDLLGETPQAIAAWDQAVLADPADPLGAGLKRDLARDKPLSETLPPAFVALLFDQYAPRFDRSLTHRLGYRGPQAITCALDLAGVTRAAQAIDLGCGTGLTGEVLRPRCQRLDGIDISAGMLAEAEAKGHYDHLENADIAEMRVRPGHYDLIVAADVFNYIGALEGVIAWCAGSLAPGGTLAFTVELGDAGYALQPALRFTHSRAYVLGLLSDAGLGPVTIQDFVLRQDRGADVNALCVTATGPAARFRLPREGEADVTA